MSLVAGFFGYLTGGPIGKDTMTAREHEYDKTDESSGKMLEHEGRRIIVDTHRDPHESDRLIPVFERTTANANDPRERPDQASRGIFTRRVIRAMPLR